jgi:hypothetical protein
MKLYINYRERYVDVMGEDVSFSQQDRSLSLHKRPNPPEPLL